MEESYRPRALRVMAEFVDDDPVWDGDVEHMGPVVLDDLGVSPALVRRLRSWNERYGRVSSGRRRPAAGRSGRRGCGRV